MRYTEFERKYRRSLQFDFAYFMIIFLLVVGCGVACLFVTYGRMDKTDLSIMDDAITKSNVLDKLEEIKVNEEEVRKSLIDSYKQFILTEEFRNQPLVKDIEARFGKVGLQDIDWDMYEINSESDGILSLLYTIKHKKRSKLILLK